MPCVGGVHAVFNHELAGWLDPKGLVDQASKRYALLSPTWHQARPGQQHPLPLPPSLQLIFHFERTHRGTHAQAVQAIGEVDAGVLQPVQRSTPCIRCLPGGALVHCRWQGLHNNTDEVHQLALWHTADSMCFMRIGFQHDRCWAQTHGVWLHMHIHNQLADNHRGLYISTAAGKPTHA